MPIRTMLAIKGSRQPQSINASSLIEVLTAKNARFARITPTAAPLPITSDANTQSVDLEAPRR